MNIDLSSEPQIQNNSLLWALEQVFQLPTKREYRALYRLVLLGKIDPEKLKRLAKRVHQQQAIRILVGRIIDYREKMEASFRLWQRTGLSKWRRACFYYVEMLAKARRALAKIYLERRKKLRELERQVRTAFRK